jgi:hypothetical protein
MFISRYGSLTSLRGAAIGVLKQKLRIAREWQNFPAARGRGDHHVVKVVGDVPQR